MGTLLKRAVLIAREEILAKKRDYRIWMLGIMTVVILIRYLHGINQYGISFGTKVTPFLLPVLLKDAGVANGLVKMLVFLGVICLFSDAPFVTSATMYQWIRSGKKAWFLGKSIYIFCASFIYTAFLALCAFLTVLPTVSFNDFWGSTLRDWINGRNNWALYAGNLEIPQDVIRMIYPWSAELLSFLAGSLCFCFIGHIIYVINVWTTTKAVGIGVAVTLVMIDPVIYYFAISEQQMWIYRFSPVSWCSIELWDIIRSGRPLNSRYVFSALLIMILICIFGVAARMSTWEGADKRQLL